MAFGYVDDPSLRWTFEAVADSYDGVRPELPDGVLDTIEALSALPPRGRVLEVGCGPGREARHLAERQYEVVAVDVGEQIVRVARRNLAEYPNVTVERADFTDWAVPPRPFDALVSFFAWHWIAQDRGLAQAAAAIRPGGAIAIVGGGHVAGGDTDFFHEVQDVYERFMPGTPHGVRLPEPDDVPPADWGLGPSEAFDEPVYRRWVQVDEYTTASYFDLLRTFSSHVALDPSSRDALFEGIGALLEERHGGRVRRATLFELCVARRQRN
jgi:SAM-dependent methyltransferase